MAEQVHGDRIALVDAGSAGAGAFAAMGAMRPLAGTDALMTCEAGSPARCCASRTACRSSWWRPVPAVAVVHAGWRGALGSLAGNGRFRARLSRRLRGLRGRRLHRRLTSRACHYQVSAEIMSQFFNTFGTLARASSGGLDLDAVVTASLDRAGVAPCNIARLGTCTAETTDRFFSYRAEDGRTGRHSAFACIVPRS